MSRQSHMWLGSVPLVPPVIQVVGECLTSPASATADWGGFHKSPKWGEGGPPIGKDDHGAPRQNRYVTSGMKTGVSTTVTAVSNMSVQTLIARGSTGLLIVADRPATGKASQ